MISIAAAIVQQQGRVSVVCDNHVHKAVVIEISEGDATTHIGYLKTAASQPGRFNEFAIAFIVK